MQIRTFTALAMISLFAAMSFFAAGPASANSALDQYVEQVPTPGGSINVDGDNPKADSLNPSVKKTLESTGDTGASLARLAAATAPVLASTEVTSGSPAKAGSNGSSLASEADREKLDKLLGADTPGLGGSLAVAAGASGLNSPLAIFVVVVALLMGGVAYRRHLRNSTR